MRVAEFIDLADAYLWQNKQPATYLLTKLREGIANLADPGLAHDLAAGRLATAPKITRQVHGFTEMQKEACESCLSAGVRLVELDCGPAALRLIEQIRRGLGGTKREALKHLGEAEVIYFLEVHAPDWTFVSDDRTAVDFARHRQLNAIDTQQVIADLYSWGEIGCPAAFELLRAMKAEGRGVRVPRSHQQVCPS